MSETWQSTDSHRHYCLDRWADGFFDISPDGRLEVNPSGMDGPGFDLTQIVDKAKEHGLTTPLLVRFPDILKQRVLGLESAFGEAGKETGYQGSYQTVYPIKVNQSASVVQAIVSASEAVGLEAGSKPELLATIACSRPGGTIICNGFKDREYIRLALSGQLLGLNVFLVVEKLSEVGLIIQIANTMQVSPQIGLRLRLASIGFGKWQNTGGEKAKFGLSPGQLIEAFNQLQQADMLDSLKLLHFHMGSQISNLRDIALGVSEAAQYYAEFRALGAPIRYLDVGGGLGVDYEGAGSRGSFSMNYSATQYATTICRTLISACERHEIPQPDLISESGRALSAHHAVLVTEVAAMESVDEGVTQPELQSDDAEVLHAMQEVLKHIDQHPLTESLEEARFLFAQGKEQFSQGQLPLRQRAALETLFFDICRQIRRRLNESDRRHQSLSATLNNLLADKYFCNLSIFRSIPDVWAIDQVFPIVPLERLHREPGRRVVLEDLTCDSDGRIDFYVESGGLEDTLRLHASEPGKPYLLGIFMVGAYQEILGDNHNLFARPNAVEVSLCQGQLHIDRIRQGDTADAALKEVGYQRDDLINKVHQKIALAGNRLDERQAASIRQTLTDNLDAYTYLALNTPQ